MKKLIAETQLFFRVVTPSLYYLHGKIQYAGKAETLFNMRLNNHRKDANGNNPKAIPACAHFKQPGHNFNNYVKLTLIEQISNTISTDIDTIKIRLKRREKTSGY